MTHAKVQVSGFEVPLIGIPDTATTQECDGCHNRLPINELRLCEGGGQFYCLPCWVSHHNNHALSATRQLRSD